MIKILCIGNSFGTDCTRYLYGVARNQGVQLKAVNLYIGGCSLYRHYRNMLSEEKVYDYEINGFRSDFKVSIKDVLLADEWTYVFTQQCSPQSGEPETYEPYATAIADYVRRLNPGANFFVHQTWTFDTGADRFKLTSFSDPETHFEATRRNYEIMADNTRACGIIPDGEAMFTLWKNREKYGIEKVHRDGFHAAYGVGRYLLALTVFGTLTGKDVRENTFSDFDTEVSERAAAGCRETAYEVTRKYLELNSAV